MGLLDWLLKRPKKDKECHHAWKPAKGGGSVCVLCGATRP